MAVQTVGHADTSRASVATAVRIIRPARRRVKLSRDRLLAVLCQQPRVAGRYPNRLGHTDGTGDSLTGDVKSRSVIYRGANKGHPGGDRDRALEVVGLGCDVALIVMER